MRRVLLTLIFIGLASSISHGQQKLNIDGDIVYLRDSLEGKVILLDSIGRKEKNENTLWIQYNRRPGVDPWIKNYARDIDKLSDEHFIDFFKRNRIIILGAVTTYDDCLCAKHRSMDSPDMYLINFKISRKDWEKMIEFYPEIQLSKKL